MPPKRQNKRKSGNRTRKTLRPGWSTPARDPPPVIENAWRYAKLKFNVLAASDSGTLENLTPARIFELLKSQQGVDVTAALSACRIIGFSSYALPGVGAAGGQVYPSTKVRVYTPMEDSSQGVLIQQREDAGTLDVAARIGYKYMPHLAQRVLNGASTAKFGQIENYHSARGYVYVNVMWTGLPN